MSHFTFILSYFVDTSSIYYIYKFSYEREHILLTVFCSLHFNFAITILGTDSRNLIFARGQIYTDFMCKMHAHDVFLAFYICQRPLSQTSRIIKRSRIKDGFNTVVTKITLYKSSIVIQDIKSNCINFCIFLCRR